MTSTDKPKPIDDAPLSGFHVRVAIYTAGGMFCDGYIVASTPAFSH